VPFDGEPTLDDIEQFLWPDPDDPGRIRGLREHTEYLHNKTDYAVVLSLGATVLHTSQYMRGFEGWFLDMALRQDFMGALMDKIVDVHVRTIRNIFHEIDGDMVDIAYIADDIAGDRGLMFSPESYRTILKPRTKKIIDQIKEFTDAKIMYHTCGAVHNLINDLIEIGVDILNPVQTSATGMDTKRLKNDFGDKISFWGGIDTRRVLPRGTVEEVREEVKNVIRNLAPGGGYVLNFVHNAQPDVKPENICAMFEAGKKYGKYPLELQ
jgi:uroporphyrinogen decarboxylase